MEVHIGMLEIGKRVGGAVNGGGEG